MASRRRVKYSSCARRVVVDIRDEGVYDGGADRSRQHRGGYPRVAEQHAVEPGEKSLERLVVGEEPDDDGVELQGCRRTATLDGHVDDAAEQHLPCAWPRRFGLRCFQRIVEPAEHPLGQRDHDLLFGLELVIDGGLGATDAVIGDQRQCGIEDAVLRRAALHCREPGLLPCALRTPHHEGSRLAMRTHGHVISAHTVRISALATKT
jgi:hypothetical protein